MRLINIGRFHGYAPLDTSVRMALGFHANLVTARANGCLSVESILNNHSVAPFVGSLLDHVAESEMFTVLRSGVPHELLDKRVGRGVIVARCIRRCPLCVMDDEVKYGVAFWRVAHQLLPIHYCAVHNVILEEMCGKCGTPYADRLVTSRTSLARCISCGSTAGMAPPDWSKKQPPAYQPFVSLLERALRGETEELRPASRLAIITSAVKFSDSSISQLIDLFCKWWGVDRPEDLRNWFGSSLTQGILSEILTGRRWVDPSLVIVAVTSFAQEWLHQRNTYIQEPLRFSAKPHCGESDLHINIESQLVERAIEVGIPEWQAIKIASAFKLTGMRMAERTLIRRFVDTLPDELRAVIDVRHTLTRAMRKSSSRSVADKLALIEHRRATVLELLNSDEGYNFRRDQTTLITWFKRNDREWLEAQLQNRLFRPYIWKTLKSAREEFSSNIEKLLKLRPSAALRDLVRQNVQLHSFLNRHDKSWLEVKKEVFKQTTYPQKKLDSLLLRRTEFLTSMNDPSVSSTALYLSATVGWLRTNDRAWYREQLLNNREQKREQKIRGNRETIIRCIEQGIRRRPDFIKAHRALYNWMLKNDKKWLDAHLPATMTFDLCK